MRVYKLDSDVNNYKSIQLCDTVDSDYYQMFDGTRIKERWETLEVKYYEEDKELKVGDSPGFNIPVFSRKALSVIYPMINNDVEILTFRLNDEVLYGINVVAVIDAIDYEQSEYRMFSDGNRIMAFKKIMFRDDAIKGRNIFKTVDFPRGDIFVSEDIYNVILNNHLEGFKLLLVYDNMI